MQDSGDVLYDVVIAGGGLAGTALALTLSRLDMRVALVEARAPLTAGVSKGPERVIALSHGSSRYLDSLGVWSDIRALDVAPIRHVSIHEPGNRGEVQMYHHQAGVEALGYVVGNDPMLQVMRHHLDGRVALISPATVYGLERLHDRVSVSVAGDAGKQRISARLLVGADGTNSPVRRMGGIGSIGWDHNRFGLVASVTTERAHGGTAYECFRSAGPLAFLPLDEVRCSIVWTLKPMEASRMMAASESEFLAALNRAAGRDMREALGEVCRPGPRACFPFEFRQAKHYVGERLALIGNAAHTLHPVAGQGLNLGLRDVAALAGVLREAQRADRDPGGAIALEAYWQKRAADTVAVESFTEGLNALFGMEFPPLRAARGLGMMAMQRIPYARDWLMRQASGLAQIGGVYDG